ncbi:hypothetical protein AVEN_196649-1 [Araneus ventricosus]|uniref:Uncharacterized protein n=1 Tax=Araneus ventricosus TaxID=182803 RepID=A0A4Y2E6T9_ARAVE|nr:hypothetical protein AVEN_196649-1 [Araneus ventricosus]
MTCLHDFIGHCGPRIIAPITSGSYDDTPVLPGYDPSSQIGPKSHTTIIVPIREARSCLLIRQLLIRELAVPLGTGYHVIFPPRSDVSRMNGACQHIYKPYPDRTEAGNRTI